MRIQDLNGRTVCILGFGREGKAMLGVIEHYAPTCEVTIADRDENIEIESGKHWQQIGTGWLKNLEKFEVIIKSPGIPPQDALRVVKDRLTTSTNIFLDTIQGTGAPSTRITLDTARILGYSLNILPGSLTLELRIPRNATGVLADKLIVVDAGHGGPSGRYDAWKDEARVQAFVLSAVGAA